MGRASSAKKVARAASVGESRRPGERRVLGFPAAVGLTMVLGVALVIFAVSTRDAAPTPTLQDHWHDAYAIYDCQSDSFLAPLTALRDANGNGYDPDGIHSHDDGLIHVHPFTSEVTGKGATMSVFFETVGVEMTDETLTLADGRVFSEDGTTCGDDDEPAVLQILRWSRAADVDSTDPEVFTEDFGDVQFLNDGEAFTIALAPLGADIPPPDTIPRLATVNPSLLDPRLGDDPDAVEVDDPDAEVQTDAEEDPETQTPDGDDADTGEADADTAG